MNDEKNLPSTADHVGEAAGGITGVVAGAAVGVSAGPLGVLLGGIAGAIGGWWAGRALVEASEDINDTDEAFYRADFDTGEHATPFEHARQAYYLGHVAASNPEYATRPFSEVERDLSRGWEHAGAPVDWNAVRNFASIGFDRGRDRRRTRPESDRRSPPAGGGPSL